MSSVEHLKEFISARLTAAAEEIFTEFEKTIEEEINRRCRMLEIAWKPHTHLHTADLLYDINKTKVCLTDQELCNQDGSSTEDQQEAEPPQIKEQQEELCISPQEDQLVLKEEPENRDNVKTESNGEQVFIQNSSLEETLKCEGSDREEPESGKNPDRNRSNHDESHRNKKRNNAAFKNGETKKVFKCDLCVKTFVRKSSLNIHRRRHTGEKPYCCVTCGKGFISSTLLNVHSHIHKDVRPYSCTTCGFGTTTKGRLTEHIRTHTGVKPFSCDTCGKRFARCSSLRNHTRIHTGEKPYFCEICGKGFTQNRILTNHKIKAHQEGPT